MRISGVSSRSGPGLTCLVGADYARSGVFPDPMQAAPQISAPRSAGRTESFRSAVNERFKRVVLSVQEYTLLAAASLANLFTPPLYLRDLVEQMDVIGVGSLPIIILTGFFIGAVLVLQTASQFARFGTTSLTADAVSIALLRELGPTITALLVAGRSSSAWPPNWAQWWSPSRWTPCGQWGLIRAASW